MRTIIPALLSLTLLAGTACTDPELAGECVPGFDYADAPTIVPSESPFILCPVSPVTPNNKAYGNFLINNCGRQTLSIDSSSITNEGDEVFKDLELESDSVNPGETSAARFLYEAIDTEEHRGTITIKSNADNFPELTIEVVVRADEPFDGGFCAPVGGGGDAGTVTDAAVED